MAKVIITIEDDGDGAASVDARVEKLETEGEGNTLAEEIGYEIMEFAAQAADEVYQDGSLVKSNGVGGKNGRH